MTRRRGRCVYAYGLGAPRSVRRCVRRAARLILSVPDSVLSRIWCKAVENIVVLVRMFWRFGDRIRVGRSSYIVAVRSSLSGREFTVLIWKFGGNYYASYYGVVLSACYCHRMAIVIL